MEVGFEITLGSPTRNIMDNRAHDGVGHASFRMETWSLVNKVASYMLGFASAHSNPKVFPHTQAFVFSGGRL